ncbi:MAG: hypothetical protein ABI528_05250 [bacterium]
MKTFSREDLKRFRDYLHSPFFNKSRKLSKFYEELIKFHPAFDSKYLSEKTLSRKICPEIPFNKLTVNSLFFDLSSLAKNYIKIIAVENNSVEADDLMRREMMNRRMFGLMEANIELTHRKLENEGNINANYYVNMFYLLTDEYNMNKINKPKSNSEKVNSTIDILTERGKMILFFFITEMVREYENILTLSKTYDTGSDTNFIVDLFNNVDFFALIETVIEKEGDTKYGKILKLYLELLQTFSDFDNEKNYHRYKRSIIKYSSVLSPDEKRFHFGRLMRYCMFKNQLSKPDNRFGIELFNIYEYILKNENYRSSVMNYMPVELYRNMLLHGLRLKKYTWTVNFIKKYSKVLHPGRRENISHFSMAEYCFSRKMYRKVKLHLNKIIFEEFIYKLNYRNILLMTHFELGEFENALYLIDSYKHFLANDTTFSTDNKKRHIKFVNIVHKLILHKTTPNRISSYYIDKEYDENFPYKDWINEKISDTSDKIKKAV